MASQTKVTWRVPRSVCQTGCQAACQRQPGMTPCNRFANQTRRQAGPRRHLEPMIGTRLFLAERKYVARLRGPGQSAKSLQIQCSKRSDGSQQASCARQGDCGT